MQQTSSTVIRLDNSKTLSTSKVGETNIDLVLDNSVAFHRPFLRYCAMTNKAMGTIWRVLSKPIERRQDPIPRPLWLLDSFSPRSLAQRKIGQSKTYSGGCHLTFFMFYLYHIRSMCIDFLLHSYCGELEEKKEWDMTQSYHKRPYTHRKIQKVKWHYKNATYKLDNTSIADRTRTINWDNDSHRTGVVKPVYGIPTFLLNAKAE